jgi:hypothetical protein
MIVLALLIAAQEGPVVTPKDAPAAAADEAAFDDSAVPPQQADAFKAFSGTWRCDGKAQTELDTDVPTRVTIRFGADAGPRWLSVKIEEQKSAKNPKAMTSSEIWGYAQALGGFVRNGADSQGGFYSGTSSGWVGDRFWWTTSTVKNGKKAILKDTLTKQVDAKGNITALVLERAIDASGSGNEAARVVYEGTCKK